MELWKSGRKKNILLIEDGEIDMAALDSDVVLERILELKGKVSVKIFNGVTGHLIRKLEK